MGNRISTGIESTFSLTFTESDVYPEALKGLAELLENLNYQYSINPSDFEDFSSRLFRVTGSDGTYAYTFGITFDSSENAYTVESLERIFNGDAPTVQPTPAVPSIPDPITGTTQADAITARDAFFTANPSLLVEGVTANLSWTSPSPDSLTYIFTGGRWGIRP